MVIITTDGWNCICSWDVNYFTCNKCIGVDTSAPLLKEDIWMVIVVVLLRYIVCIFENTMWFQLTFSMWLWLSGSFKVALLHLACCDLEPLIMSTAYPLLISINIVDPVFMHLRMNKHTLLIFMEWLRILHVCHFAIFGSSDPIGKLLFLYTIYLVPISRLFLWNGMYIRI